MEASSESPKIKTWVNNSISLNIKEVAVDMVATAPTATEDTAATAMVAMAMAGTETTAMAGMETTPMGTPRMRTRPSRPTHR